MNNLVYALPSILLIATANVCLKWRLDHFAKKGFVIFSKNFFNIVFDPYIAFAVIATGLSIAWWLNIMPSVKVSVVYPLIQAGVIVVTAMMSILLLGEKILPLQLFGLILLIAGIAVSSIGGST